MNYYAVVTLIYSASNLLNPDQLNGRKVTAGRPTKRERERERENMHKLVGGEKL